MRMSPVEPYKLVVGQATILLTFEYLHSGTRAFGMLYFDHNDNSSERYEIIRETAPVLYLDYCPTEIAFKIACNLLNTDQVVFDRIEEKLYGLCVELLGDCQCGWDEDEDES